MYFTTLFDHLFLSKSLQNRSVRCTRSINKKKQWLGYLFQGCSKAFSVDTKSYFFALVDNRMDACLGVKTLFGVYCLGLIFTMARQVAG